MLLVCVIILKFDLFLTVIFSYIAVNQISPAHFSNPYMLNQPPLSKKLSCLNMSLCVLKYFAFGFVLARCARCPKSSFGGKSLTFTFLENERSVEVFHKYLPGNYKLCHMILIYSAIFLLSII